MADWFKELAGKKGKADREKREAEEKAAKERAETEAKKPAGEGRSTIEQIRDDRQRVARDRDISGLLGSEHGGRRTA